MPSLSELATDGAQNSSGGSSSDSSGGSADYERYDRGDEAWSKNFPSTAVRGTLVALDHQPDFNERDDGTMVPDMTTMDFGVVLEDPSVFVDDEDFAGGVIVHGTSEYGDDNRVYDENDDQTEIMADAGKVIFGSDAFDGEVDDEFVTDDDGRIYLKVSGAAGKSVVSTLDLKGKGGAHQIGAYDGEDIELHDGGYPQHSGHLFERNPDDDADDYMMVAGVDPEARPDVVGREVIIAIQRGSEVLPDYEGNSYWATVFASLDDERRDELAEQYAEQFNAEHDDDTREASDFMFEDDDGTTFLRLQPTNEFERSRGNLIENGWIEWQTVDDDALAEARAEAGFE